MGTYSASPSASAAFNAGAVEFDSGVTSTALYISAPGPFSYGYLLTGVGLYTIIMSIDANVTATGTFKVTFKLYDAGDDSLLDTVIDTQTVGATGVQTLSVASGVTTTVPSTFQVRFDGAGSATGTIFTSSLLSLTESVPARLWWTGLVGWGPASAEGG